MSAIKWKDEYALLKPVVIKKGADLTGRRFSYLHVLYKVKPNDKKMCYWMCECDCGNKTLARTEDLITKQKKSCGCQHRFYSHHGTETRLYHIWCGLKARCNNPNSPKYHSYGARGISVCEEWMHDFDAFRTWALNNGYSDNLSIDRIDNDGNYEPGNCRWATGIEQSNNTSKNIRHEFNGKMLTAHEIAIETGYPLTRLRNRLRYGWTVEEALNTPFKCRPQRLEQKNIKTMVFKNGKMVGVFNSMQEASNFSGESINSVYKCVRGQRDQSNGYTFKRYEEVAT